MSSDTDPPHSPPRAAEHTPGEVPEPGQPDVAPAMGRAAGAGVSWMVLATGLTKVATIVAQGVLGWLLTGEDFGLFAIAVAVSGLLVICRDGGVRDLLVQRGVAEYPSLSGPAFWMALTFNIMSAAALACVAWPLALWAYGDARLMPMLWIIALSIPLATPAGILQSRLRLDLRFNALSKLTLLSAVVRQSSTVMLAWFRPDLGALCFAIPFVIVAAVDSISAFIAVADAPWMRLPHIARWPGMVRRTGWLIFGSFANFALDFGPYIGLGLVLPYTTVGIYFFAYQLVAQLGVLLSYNLQVVLFSILGRLNDDPERQRQAALRSLRALMMAGSLSCIAVATIIAPLETLIWRGRWAAIVLPVQILGFLFPWRITFGLSTALLLAQGKFKMHAATTAFEGGGLLAAAMIGALIEPTASSVALWTGGWLVIGRGSVTIYVFVHSGTSIAPVLRALLGPWMLAAAAGATAILIESGLGVGPALAARLSAAEWVHERGIATEVAQLTRILLAGSLCAGLFALGARLLLKGDLKALLAVAPAPVRPLVSRALLLR